MVRAAGDRVERRSIVAPLSVVCEGGSVSEEIEWTIPKTAQPRADDFAFDLERALASVVAVRAEIPQDAFTASILGTERAGNGVVIDRNGLILTIGYLITEAESIWLTTLDGTAAPAHVVGYDPMTGFGLVQALGRLGAPPLELGTAAATEVGDTVIVAGEGGLAHALKAAVVSKREFAGYWEYVVDEASRRAAYRPSS
jgi:S1-C subfamily serine protease